MGVHSMIGSIGDELSSGVSEEDLGMLLREQKRQEAIDRERELNFYRSGSAPPTVEGSLAAVGRLFGRVTGGGVSDLLDSENGDGILSEKELRSNPAYLNYYYSHVNMNPRLPPPVLSKEDWRSTQRLQVGRSVLHGIGDTRKVTHWEEGGGISIFSKQPLFRLQEHVVEPREAPDLGKRLDKGGEGLIGLSLSRQMSFANVDVRNLSSRLSDPIEPHRSTISSANSYVKSYSPPDSSPGGSPGHFQNIKSVDACSGGIRPSGYSVNPAFPPSMLQNHVAAGTMPPLFESAAAASAIGSLTIDCGTSDGAVDFGCRRSIEGEIGLIEGENGKKKKRKRRKKKRRRRKPSAVLARAPSPRVARAPLRGERPLPLFLPHEETFRLLARGERSRRCRPFSFF
ncbi:hypothetical protein BHM03_00055070 [Ensete ventricosum]|nr:hypothetical protein BHM03_00055070 [Ensete ventricosum]